MGTNNQPVENNLSDVHVFMDSAGFNDILNNFPGDHGEYHSGTVYDSYSVDQKMYPRMTIDFDSVSANESYNHRIPVTEDKGHNHIVRIEYKDNRGDMKVLYDPSKDYEHQVRVEYTAKYLPLKQRETVDSIYAGYDFNGYKDYSVVTDIDEAVARMNAYCVEHQDEISAALKESDFGKYASNSPGFADAMKEASDLEADWQQRVDEHNQELEQQRLEHEQQKADRQARSEQQAERIKEFFSGIGEFFTGDREHD